MNVRPFFIPHAQATELMQPSDGALDDPSQGAQASAVRQSPPRQAALDTPFSQGLPVRLRIIRAIA